ncbi:hypothetical protein CVT24_007132 [Panaeolus cyanescens]|uniref:Uncharacterized protein n=1 Tax=Panaeolus cyanescens TaxID=181874 RepID=A0A409YP93_9AGAR|nr:hypothetical protein CVT24_007132 [Panaeolus cyanescens]
MDYLAKYSHLLWYTLLDEWKKAAEINRFTLSRKAADVPLSKLIALKYHKIVDAILIGEVIERRLEKLMCQFELTGFILIRFLYYYDAKLSGSAIICIIFPNPGFEPDDLDFYLEAKHESAALEFLRNHGYIISAPIYDNSRTSTNLPAGPYPIYSAPNTNTYTRLYRLFLPKPYTKTINIVISKGRAILPILGFHSSGVMNYMAHHGLVILYPETTFKRISIPNAPDSIYSMDARTIAAIDKYKNRNWTFKRTNELSSVPHNCTADPYCAQTIRSLHDKAVLHIPSTDLAMAPGYSAYKALKSDANRALWMLSGGKHCYEGSNCDNVGFAYVDATEILASSAAKTEKHQFI